MIIIAIHFYKIQIIKLFFKNLMVKVKFSKIKLIRYLKQVVLMLAEANFKGQNLQLQREMLYHRKVQWKFIFLLNIINMLDIFLMIKHYIIKNKRDSMNKWITKDQSKLLKKMFLQFIPNLITLNPKKEHNLAM